MPRDDIKNFFKTVLVCYPDINGITTLSRHYIVLFPRSYDRSSHFNFPKRWRYFRKFIVAKPFNILHSLIDRVHTFFPCSVASFPLHNTIQNHKSFFRYGHLTERRLAHNGKIDLWQQLPNALNALTSGDLLLGSSCHHKVELEILLFVEMKERNDEANERTACVITSEAVKLPVNDLSLKRIAGIRTVRPHGVVV